MNHARSRDLSNPSRYLRRFWLELTVVTIGIILTLAAYLYTDREVDHGLRLEATETSNQMASSVRERMRDFEMVMRGASLFLDRVPHARPQDWVALAEQFDLPARSHTVSGFGYAEIFAPGVQLRQERRQSTDTSADPRMRSAGWRITSVISLLYVPGTANRNVPAMDLLSEPIRRETVERARDSGTMALSAQLDWVMGGANPQPGLLAVLPVYAPYGARFTTEEERRKHFRGFIFLSILTANLFSEIANSFEDSALRILDHTRREEPQALYSNSIQRAREQGAAGGRRSIVVRNLSIGGRDWSVEATSDTGDLPTLERYASVVTLVTGMGMTVLLAGLVHFNQRTRRRAVIFSDHMTSELADRKLLLLSQEAVLEAMNVTAPTGVLRVSGDGRVRYINARAADLLGHEALELNSDAWLDRIYPEDRGDVMALFAGQAHPPDTKVLEIRLMHDDDALHWIRFSAAGMQNGAEFVCSVEDVTTRKQAEREAQRAREFLDAVLDLVPNTVFVKDQSGAFRLLNRPACEFLGIPYGTGIGKTDFDLFRPEQAQRFVMEDKAVLRTHEALKLEGVFETVRGDTRWVMKNKTRVVLADGETFVVGSITDITDRHILEQNLKAAQAELSEAREFLASVLDSIPVPVVVKDETGKMLLVNRAMEKVTAKQRSELLGKSDFELFAPELAATLREGDEQVLLAQGPVTYDGPYMLLAAGERWIVRNKNAVRFVDGSRVVVTTLTDITERKNAEAESQRARLFLENLLNALPNAIFVKDRQHHWVLVNDAFAQTTGRNRQTLIGKSDPDVFPSAVAEQNWAEDNAVRMSRAPAITEQKNVDVTGREVWYLKTKSVLTLADGLEYVVGIRTDITETKLATLKIEREREFLTNVIEALPSPFYVKDRQYRWIIVNAEMGRLFGCDPAELIGLSDADRRSVEDAARTLAEDEQCFAEPGVHYFEDAYRYPDGSVRYKLKSKAAIRLTTGEQFLVGFSADIDGLKKLESELREAEAAARQAEEFTRLVLDSIPTPVSVKDERGVYLLVNRATERLLGKSRSELVGRTDLDLPGHDHAAASRDADQQALDSRSPVVSDWPCTDSAGASLWMIRVMTSMQLADRSRFLVTVMTDITDRKKAESEVEKARSFLEELINAFPMPISVKDRQHLWVMVNAAKAVLVGATPKEMIGRSDPDYYSADYAAEAWQEDEDLFATGVPIVKEQSVSTPGHADHWVVRNKSLISLADGTQYVVGINVDVTERKRIAREAERQRDFLQYIVNALPSPFYVKDSRHRWVMANQAAVAVIAGAGVDMGSFLGKTDSDFRDAAACVRAWEEDDLCLREPGVHGFEDSIVIDGNREIHFLKSKVAVRMPDGDQFVVGFNTDVTERSRAALEVERSRAFLQAVVETMPYGIWIKDEQHRHILVNEWETRRMHRALEEFIGKTAEELFEAEMAAAIMAEDDATFRADVPLQFEHYMPATTGPDGRAEQGRWILKTKAQRTLPDGSRYLIGTAQDVTSIKLAEVAARRERQFLEKIIDAIPYTMYVKDEGRRWVLVNHAGTLQSGLPKTAMIGRSDSEVFDASEAARNIQEDKLCFASSEPQFFECEIVFADGQKRSLLKSKQSITLEDGSRFLVGLNTDVSSLKRTERALLMSQSRLNLLNSIASALTAGHAMERVQHLAIDGLWRMFPSLRWTYSEMIDETRARVLCCASGPTMVDITGMEYLFDMDASSVESLRAGHHVEIEDFHQIPDRKVARKAEREFGTRARMTLPFVDNGQLVGVLSAASVEPRAWAQQEVEVARDVVEYLAMGRHNENAETQRRAIQHALESSETRLKSIIETAAEGIVIIDGAGLIRMANPAVASMFGYQEGDLLGRDVNLLIPDGDVTLVIGMTQQLRGRRSDGTELPIDLLVSESTVKGESLFTAMIRDITERVRVDEELRAHRDNLAQLVEERTLEMRLARDAAEEANLAKSEFLSNMSHELRTPMHAIIAYAKLGLEKLDAGGPSGEKLHQYLSRIDQGAGRLLMLLNDLLDLSKLEAGKMTYRMDMTDMAELIAGAAQEFHAFAGSRRITLVLDNTGAQQAWCDKGRIGQVIRNLLSNAIKFTAEGKKIHVRIGQDRIMIGRRSSDSRSVDAVRVSVVDEGVGIPDGELNAVFDKFVQSSKTKTGSGGTGLGLAICREIVEAHAGKIWAENNATGGATFHFTLAASQAAMATVLDEPYRVGSEPLIRNEATKK